MQLFLFAEEMVSGLKTGNFMHDFIILIVGGKLE